MLLPMDCAVSERMRAARLAEAAHDGGVVGFHENQPRGISRRMRA